MIAMIMPTVLHAHLPGKKTSYPSCGEDDLKRTIRVLHLWVWHQVNSGVKGICGLYLSLETLHAMVRRSPNYWTTDTGFDRRKPAARDPWTKLEYILVSLAPCK